jgi:pimeloyl-ACP methyl ester carboxylesterase
MATLDRDGYEIYYDESGGGEPLLLIHGAVSSGTCFEEHIPKLVSDFRLIVPDLRGMGKSRHADGMSPTAWTDDVLALLDHLRIERAHVCGTSLGARIALRLALEVPARVATVVADSPIVADSPSQTAAIERAFGPDLTPELAKQFEYWNGPEWRTVLGNYLAIRRQPGLQEYYDLRGELNGLTCPVLVTRGDIDDSIHPLSHAFEVHAQVEKSALWVSPATPFSAVRYRPAQFTQLFRSFVAASAGIQPGQLQDSM